MTTKLVSAMALYAGLLATAGILPQTAQAQLSCTLSQLTNSSGGENTLPKISADGTRIVFTSDRDLVSGLNSDLNEEVFFADTATGAITQVTNTNGSAVSNGGSLAAATPNANGTRISFASNGNLAGGNADGNFEVFLFDTTTGAFRQITTTSGEFTFNFNPIINANGTRIALDSDASPTGSNADGNFEVFLFDISAGTLRQITNTVGAGSGASKLDASGAHVAFTSSNNLTGGNSDRNQEVFLFDVTTSAFRQITNTTGGDPGGHSGANTGAIIDANGTHVAFTSNRDLTGANADGNFEVFLFDIAASAFRQITNTAGGANTTLSIDSDGTRVAITSNRNLTGRNADLNSEVFVFETSNGSFTQLTNTTGGSSGSASMNAAGTRVAFISNRDLAASNADGNPEVFLANCSSAPPPLCNGRIATIVRTNASERIIGTPGPDVIAGLGGNDVIFGLGGNDVICGGLGNDTIFGGPGSNRLFGGPGNDSVNGGPSIDQLNGNQGVDRCNGGPPARGDNAKTCEQVRNVP